MNRPRTRPVAFIGSYSPQDRPGIFAFTLGADSVLRMQSAWAGVTNPSFLVAHPGGRHLYAVGETGTATHGTPGTVHAFRVEDSEGQVDLAVLNQQPSSGDHPCHLSIDLEGRWLAVSNYGTGNLGVFPIRRDGSLADVASVVQHSGAGLRVDRQSGPHPHSSVFTPDGRFLIVADLGIDRLIVYGFDSGNGSMERINATPTKPGAGPRHMSMHPDGRHLFVVNELENSISLFQWSQADGSLHLRQSLPTLPDDVSGGTAADVHISDSGEYLYVSNRGHDSLAVYRFDSTHGLTRTAIRSCGGSTPRGFALVPGGSHTLVANQNSDELALLPLADGGSDLGAPIARAPVSEPTCVTFIP